MLGCGRSECMMTAILPTSNISKARNLSESKETIRRRVALVILYTGVTNSGLITHEAVDARWYKSRSADGASPLACSVWMCGAKREFSGHGVAKGYGYHKSSAALYSAFNSCGVKLSQNLDGSGDSAIDEAMTAVARELYPDAAEIVLV